MDNSNMNTSDSSTPRTRKIHPLVATAAGAVIVASLAATAAVTGLFPKVSSTPSTNDQTQAAQVAQQSVPTPAPVPAAPAPATNQAALQQQAEQSAAQLAAQQQATSAQPPQAAPQPVAPPQQPAYAQQSPPPHAAYCSTCGTVEAVSAVRHEGHGTGLGAVGGAVVGGLVGNQFGRGGGRTGMTLLGALGGGLGGNAVEKNLRSETDYSVRVHMENGRTRYFTYREQPPFSQGERVHIENGTLAAG